MNFFLLLIEISKAFYNKKKLNNDFKRVYMATRIMPRAILNARFFRWGGLI